MSYGWLISLNTWIQPYMHDRIQLKDNGRVLFYLQVFFDGMLNLLIINKIKGIFMYKRNFGGKRTKFWNYLCAQYHSCIRPLIRGFSQYVVAMNRLRTVLSIIFAEWLCCLGFLRCLLSFLTSRKKPNTHVHFSWLWKLFRSYIENMTRKATKTKSYVYDRSKFGFVAKTFHYATVFASIGNVAKEDLATNLKRGQS